MNIISLQEFADLTNLPKRDARMLTREPGFPAIFVGQKVLIDADELMLWMKKNRGESFRSYEETRDRRDRQKRA